MIKVMRQLFSDSLAFALVTLGNKLVSFLLLPVYTKYLQTGQFGDWDLTNTLTLLITYVCILGTDAALAFYYFDVKTVQEKKSYFSAAVFFSVACSLVLLLVSLLFNQQIAEFVYNGKENYSLLVILAVVSTVEGIFIQQMLAFARFSRRVTVFKVMSMVYWIGSSLLNILFLVVFNYGVIGIFYGQVLGGAITSLLLILIFWEQFTFRIRREHWVNLVKYGAPLVPFLISFWVLNSLNRPIIYHMVSKSDAGIYGAAVRVASFIALITSAFQLAWRPFAMSIKDREDAPYIFSMVARGLLIAGTILVLVITFYIKPVMMLIAHKNPQYVEAYPIIWMLSLGTLMNTLGIVVSVGLFISKKTAEVSKAFMFATVFYLIGNVLFVPVYSYWCTAVMTLATYVFVFYYGYVRSQIVYPVPFQIRSITGYLAIYILVMIGITYIQVNNFSYQWVYNVLALGAVFASIFFTRLVRIEQLRDLRRVLSSLTFRR